MLLGVLFGSIGFGYFLYGSKQKALVPWFCGVAMMAAPYFIANNLLLVLAEVGLMAVAYFVRF
ncbi:MAG: hypothetical protein RL748_3672 [Pseudomonadota bacterium]|jgi:hypothetical protein